VAKVDGPVWSLVVELHFYLLLPLLALGIAAVARGSRARAAVALGVLGVAALAMRWYTVDGVRNIDPLWQYNLPSTFFFFIPGMLLAILKISWESETPTWLRGPLRHGSTWLALTVPLWVLVFRDYNWDALVGVATFLTIGACVLPLGQSRVVRALEWRPLAVLGTASYSLYLWHLPIVDHLVTHQLAGDPLVVLVAVIVPLTCVIALVSYRVIEAPWLRIRKRWQGPVPAPAAA
jgi:peptidoglycan/LPS O-acetylase OafA/YrhL